MRVKHVRRVRAERVERLALEQALQQLGNYEQKLQKMHATLRDATIALTDNTSKLHLQAEHLNQLERAQKSATTRLNKVRASEASLRRTLRMKGETTKATQLS